MKFEDPDLLYHRHNRFSPIYPMQPKKIDFYEMTVLLSGHMTYIADGREIILSSGDALFLKAGTRRSRKAGDSSDYISFNFRCDGCFDGISPKTARFADKEVQLIIDAYDESMKNKRLKTPDRAEVYLRLLLMKLEDLSKRKQISPLTEKIQSYLEDNIEKRITLEEIGGYTNFSPIYSATLFKREVGETVISYFNRLKIERAKVLIIENQMPLCRVAESLGFDDYNYFSRLFKKICGYSPSQYKRRFLGYI